MVTTTPRAPASSPATREPRRRVLRADIQALRAFAVVAVLAFHADVPWVSGGYTGVDVFFVISGFLITGHLLTVPRDDVRAGLLDFYGRRILRLLPVSALVVVATVLLGRWLLPPLGFDALGSSGRASALYYVNVFLARRNLDYFADTTPSPFQHYWSLAVEEQFYVVWPLLLLALALLVRRDRRAVAAVVGVLVVVSFAWSSRLTTTSAPDAFYLLPSRAWEFGIGALLAIGAPLVARLRGPVATVTVWAGVLTLVAGVVLIGDRTPFPGWVALVPALGTAAVVAGGTTTPRGGLDRVGASAPVAWTGAASYPLYLWHWPLLTVPALTQVAPLGVPTRALLVAATVALAALTHHLLEDPVRRSRRLRARPAWPFLLAVVLTVVTVATTTLLGRTPTLAVAQTLPSWPAGATTAEAPAPTVVGANLTPDLESAFRDRPSTIGTPCFVAATSDVPTPCEFGDPAGGRTLVLFGDSHAQQWLPGVDALAAREGVRVVTFLKGSCPAQVVTVRNVTLGRRYDECTRWRTAALARIAALRPDVVVAAGYTRQPLAGGDAEAPARWAQGTRELVTALPSSARVVVLGDGPHWASGRPGCLSEHLTRADRCTANVFDVADTPVRDAVATAATTAGAELFDTMELLCPGGRCPSILWDVTVYRDDNHVTATLARAVQDELAPLLPAS